MSFDGVRAVRFVDLFKLGAHFLQLLLVLVADLPDDGLEVREGLGFFTDLKLELLDIFRLCVD